MDKTKKIKTTYYHLKRKKYILYILYKSNVNTMTRSLLSACGFAECLGFCRVLNIFSLPSTALDKEKKLGKEYFC